MARGRRGRRAAHLAALAAREGRRDKSAWREAAACHHAGGVARVGRPRRLDGAGCVKEARAQRLDELEFYYPAQTITLVDLNALLERHGQPELGRSARDGDLPTPLTQGYVKGFIDLVFEARGRFYLVDYKSNWLGAGPEDYAREHLPAAMEEHLYTFQYLTYTVALHRMLEHRQA